MNIEDFLYSLKDDTVKVQLRSISKPLFITEGNVLNVLNFIHDESNKGILGRQVYEVQRLYGPEGILSQQNMYIIYII